MNKTSIIILSDPNNGEETLGRAFNALAAAFDIKEKGGEVSIILAGAGTRWAGILPNADHPLNPFFKVLVNNFAGVSCGCADFFGARESAEKSNFPILDESKIPGTSGLPSYYRLLNENENDNVLTF
ncbi:MAG: hypothetical protein HRT88_18120 [Lentisphaeraceae bacterium]|nr:hypothetical protein [Lentisphaeraceae bacterium]